MMRINYGVLLNFIIKLYSHKCWTIPKIIITEYHAICKIHKEHERKTQQPPPKNQRNKETKPNQPNKMKPTKKNKAKPRKEKLREAQRNQVAEREKILNKLNTQFFLQATCFSLDVAK